MISRTMTLCLACALAAACARDDAGNAADGDQAANAGAPEAAEQARTTIGESLDTSIDHATFHQMLQSAGLAETLSGVGPYTVFAPTEAAFAAIPDEARARLTSADQRERLIGVLSHHIVPGTVTAQDLTAAIDRGTSGRAELATVTGANLSLFREGDAILIGDGGGGRARITRADQIHTNGVVHSIDTVLMPSDGD
jgi:uncharacterized surface protein with fasciclin (FAS1) repeats